MIMMIEYLQQSADALTPPANEVHAALNIALEEAHAYRTSELLSAASRDRPLLN